MESPKLIGRLKASGPALLDTPVVMQTLKLSNKGTGEYLDWTAWELLGAAELVSEIDAAYGQEDCVESWL